MSDILPQIEPETQGHVTKLDVPLTQFLGQAARPDVADSMWNAVAHTTEDEINKMYVNRKELQPDEANQKYAIGSLKFTQPIDELTAQSMNERERNKMDQQMYLYSGATKGRWMPGMAAQVLGASANPLDLGSMFLPFVGAGAKLEEGAGVIARSLNRGLIPSEAFKNVPLPKLVSSMAQATMWQGMAEVPKIMEAHIEGQPNPHITEELLGQAAFAGGLHAGAQLLGLLKAGVLDGVARGMRELADSTHETMAKQTVNDFLTDKDTSAAQYIPMDEHVIEYRAQEEMRKLREEAANSPEIRNQTEQAKRDLMREMGEYPTDAALRHYQTGEVRTGLAHSDIEGYDHSWDTDKKQAGTPENPWEQGFVTDKGRFVNRAEADQMTGSGGSFLTSEALRSGTSDPDWLSHDERTHFDDFKEMGLTDAEAINKIREMRENRRQQRIQANPEFQKRVEMFRQAAIDDWVHNRKAQIADPVPKQTKAAAHEKTVPHDEVQKRNGDMEHLHKSLDEDIHGLGGKTPEEEQRDQRDAFEKFLDHAIDKLKSDPTLLHFDPLLIKSVGAPVLRDILMAVREAYKVSKDLMRAIKEALAAHSITDPEIESKLFSELTKGEDFRYSVQAELDKDLPFNVKPERFTAQVINSRISQLPAPERAILKNAGLEDFLKQYGTGVVDRAALKSFVDSHMPQFEIRPLLNVKPVHGGSDALKEADKLQHELETRGYSFVPIDNWDDIQSASKPRDETAEDREKFKRLAELHDQLASGAFDQPAPAPPGKLAAYVGENISVPIAFEKMENPRTIFLAAPQDVHVGSSHYEDVKFEGPTHAPVEDDLIGSYGIFNAEGKLLSGGMAADSSHSQGHIFREIKKGDVWNALRRRNMLAWAETHVVTMPDGRKVLHVFEEQSDIEQSFKVDETSYDEGPAGSSGKYTANYINESGKHSAKFFETRTEAQKFVDQKLHEFRDKVQPLIEDHKQILMKAAVKLAMREKLDGVVVSDPRTAMLTQGHLGSTDPKSWYYEHGATGWSGSKTIEEVEAEYGKPPPYIPPSQAHGMEQAYGQELPRLLEKITGQKPEHVDMGQKHYIDEAMSDNPPEYSDADQERLEFDKHFHGSDNISGNFFGTKHLDPTRPFEVFTPRSAMPDVPKAIDAAMSCLLEKMI